MSVEAIKDQEIQDVSDIENQEQQEVEQVENQNLTPREEKLQSLNKKYDSSHTDNFDPDKTEAEESDDIPEDPQEQKPKSPVYLNDKGEYVMKLKVNGVEVERTLEQITATAQKDVAADQRLQEAAESRKQLEQQAAQLQQWQQSLDAEHKRLESLAKDTQLSQQDAGQEADASDVRALVAQHREYLYDGDTEKADEVMMQLIGLGRQQPTLNVDEVVNQAVQRSVQEQQRMTQQVEQERLQVEYKASLQRGGQWARENYGELLNDPDMYRLVDGKTEEIYKENPNLTPEEVIKKATEYVAQRFGKQPVNQREGNKQKLPAQPKRLANSRHVTQKQPVVDNSPAAALQRIKEQRQAIQNRPVN